MPLSFPQISLSVGNMMTRLIFLFAILSVSSCATIERGSRILGGDRNPRTLEETTTAEFLFWPGPGGRETGTCGERKTVPAVYQTNGTFM